MIVLGLTGSMGMGKTTTAAMFRDLGVPVWDADAAVHALYGPGGAAVAAVAALCPSAVSGGGVDRAALRTALRADPSLLPRIETAVHPLVAADRARFLAGATGPLAVLDVPLLFETGLDAAVDRTVVVTAPPEVQRARLLARGTMSPAELETLLARQMPDADKRARADHVIETLTQDGAAAQVAAIVRDLTGDRA